MVVFRSSDRRYKWERQGINMHIHKALRIGIKMSRRINKEDKKEGQEYGI